MNVKPLYDKVIIRQAPEKTKSSGGILLPGAVTEKPAYGTVLATGEGRMLTTGKIKPLVVKNGDEVLFPAGFGTEVTIDGDTVLVMSEDDILGVIDKPAKSKKTTSKKKKAEEIN